MQASFGVVMIIVMLSVGCLALFVCFFAFFALFTCRKSAKEKELEVQNIEETMIYLFQAYVEWFQE